MSTWDAEECVGQLARLGNYQSYLREKNIGLHTNEN